MMTVLTKVNKHELEQHSADVVSPATSFGNHAPGFAVLGDAGRSPKFHKMPQW